jgi:ABC-type transport system involved in multi-copper enzyme maturation permease subunit
MSISAPRYASAPTRLEPRPYRVQAIVRREFARRAGWATLVPLILIFMFVAIPIAVEGALFFAFQKPSVATFEGPLESVAWPFLLLIVATSAGAGSIAEDIGTRSITLYLSRPIHLTDYLVAKALACGSWILLATAGPGVVGITIVALLGYVPAATAVSAVAAYLAMGLVATVFLTGLLLALSCLTNRSLNAGVAFLGLLLSLLIGIEVVSGTTGNHLVRYASPLTDLRGVARAAFGVSGGIPTDPWVSAAGLIVAGILLALFALRTLSRIEVVGE